jgi:tryptophanyl-tRNA synthetase
MTVNFVASRRHAAKMSKSDPDGTVFIEDGHDEIFRKIGNFIFPIEPDDNLLFDYIKDIIFRKFPSITLCGNVEESVDDVREIIAQLHIQQVQFKVDIVQCIDVSIQPIMNHFCSIPELQDLFRRVESYRISSDR